MAVRGAGGTSGGAGRFFIGLAMLVAGGYLFLDAIKITHHFNFGYTHYSWGNFHLTTGMVLIPMILGIGMIFYNARSIIGWFLSVGSLIMLSVGVITSLQFRMRGMSAFDLIMILILFVGGLGLFLSSLKEYKE